MVAVFTFSLSIPHFIPRPLSSLFKLHFKHTLIQNKYLKYFFSFTINFKTLHPKKPEHHIFEISKPRTHTIQNPKATRVSAKLGKKNFNYLKGI